VEKQCVEKQWLDKPCLVEQKPCLVGHFWLGGACFLECIERLISVKRRG
jgi:hypothetical protein